MIPYELEIAIIGIMEGVPVYDMQFGRIVMIYSPN